MGTIALPGTSNTVYVTVPDSITVTPSNINSYLSSIYTPKITTKNAVGTTATRYFAIYASWFPGTGHTLLGVWKATLTKGSKTGTNITALSNNTDAKRERLGCIAEVKSNNVTNPFPFQYLYAEEATDAIMSEPFTQGYVSCSFKFDKFNPSATSVITSRSIGSSINGQFGFVKGFCYGECDVTVKYNNGGSYFSWSNASGGGYQGKIKPTLTIKLSANGKTASRISTPDTITVDKILSLDFETINNTSVTQITTITNSLGGSYTRTDPSTITIQDYIKPQLSNIKVARSGTDAVITLDWSVAGVNKSSTETQSVTVGTVKVDWTATANTAGAPTWNGTQVIVANGSAMSGITGTLPITDSTHQYNKDVSYTFEITLTDRLGQTASVTTILPSEFYTIDFKAGGRGIAIGTAAIKDAFECAMDPFFTTWIGIIQMFGGKNPPNGWLICDGASKLISAFPELAAALYDSTAGLYIYGSADSTHFNLPDLRGRFPIGVGNGTASGHTNHPIGSTSGNEDLIIPYHRHTLPSLETGDASQGHTHTLNSHTHTTGSGTHFMYRDTDGASSTRSAVGGSGKYTWTSGSVSGFLSSTNTGGPSTNTSGGQSQTHKHTVAAGKTTNYSANAADGATPRTTNNTTGANMPPYIGLNFIIYAGRDTV